MKGDDRDLGMHRDITRRDFLNGVAVGAAPGRAGAAADAELGAALRAQAGAAAAAATGDYPPALTGMRGSHAGSFEVAHQLRDARGPGATRRPTPASATTSSSSAAASAGWRRPTTSAPPSDRRRPVLVLDNHDDFGGHAKRNEFTHDGRMLMLNGGTLNIEAPQQYSDVAMGLLRRIGVDIDRFERDTAADRGLYQRMGLRNGVFFPQGEVRGGSPGRRHPGGGATKDAWAEFLARTPARRERPARPGPPAEPRSARLHARALGRGEEAAAHAHELPAVPRSRSRRCTRTQRGSTRRAPPGCS